MNTMTSIKKKLALVSTAALLAVGVVAIPSQAHAVAPQCGPANASTGYVSTCGGVTSEGAPYAMLVPANYNGTVFIYSHGYRYNIDVPPLGYKLSTILATPQPGPLANNTDQSAIKYLLSKGYAVTGSAFAPEGWNAASAVKTDVELIGLFKAQFPKTTKVIAWGESLGGFITEALAEQNPNLVNAAGLMCPALGTVEAELSGAGDFLWGMKTFFDNKIQGHNYAAGAAGVAQAYSDLAEIAATAKSLQASLVTNQWPATSGAAGTALAAIPPRSALLLVGLMAGIPTKSAHFDGTTGPGKKTDAAYTSFALAASPALAVLENGAQAAALAVIATLDLEQQTGGAFYDNSKTDYAARVSDDLVSYNAALSGTTAINGMLAFLNPANPDAPRWTETNGAHAKLQALMQNTGNIKVPTIALAATADPIVPAGNTQWLADKYGPQLAAAQDAAMKSYTKASGYTAAKQLFLPIWNNPPASYTKFNADGTPNTTVPAATGTNHCNFTTKQYINFAGMLVDAAATGDVSPKAAVRQAARKSGAIVDLTYQAPLLPFYRK